MVCYVLDENLIDFGSALEEQDYDRCPVALAILNRWLCCPTQFQWMSICCTSFEWVLSRVPHDVTVHSSLLSRQSA